MWEPFLSRSTVDGDGGETAVYAAAAVAGGGWWDQLVAGWRPSVRWAAADRERGSKGEEGEERLSATPPEAWLAISGGYSPAEPRE